MTDLPPLAAIFLTHFDDIKGQSVVFYASLPDLPAKTIEHTTLPSGLHVLDSDLVLFTHHDLPGAGVFRSRLSDEGTRGRRMGTLGVVLAPPSVPSDLFALHSPLAELFDQLEALESSPFAPSSSTNPSSAVSLLAKTWHDHRADSKAGSTKVKSTSSSASGEEARRMVEGLISGRGGMGSLPIEHPVAYLPSLLGVLGPSIVPIYKAALSGQRILLYSTPPLLPLAAFAWCIWAMSLPPSSAHDAETSVWLGNVGLMDLIEVKDRKGGWIATTSDAIYRSHHNVYDVFIDLSSIPLSSFTDPHLHQTPELPTSIPTPRILSTYNQPPTPITYSFADLPLYRSLLLLSSSPPTVHAGISKTGGWWLLAFELIERAWKLCVGVCEFAVGRGGGQVHLEDGEEDARLLDDTVDLDLDNGIITSLEEAEAEAEAEGEEEDEAVRRGRLILRQFQHNTFHLNHQLRSTINSRPRSRTNGQVTSSASSPLTNTELRYLVGSKWFGGGGVGPEGRFWQDIARVWGVTVATEDN
ncbi:hypothetical protein CI109_102218 [Kwoniella shandongensis]|uniref:Uncharacterized protein n=1 Tax=Kwoniella shandongensis TaxID=1734106 RepID=A0A5M6BZ41_9TREE|nr:uncharacterized protein CI109_003628 [Kwoniella shandongensis]KAA5527973.1 hypothetical protein CI109_003628 [Kwoniella shandongensis]